MSHVFFVANVLCPSDADDFFPDEENPPQCSFSEGNTTQEGNKGTIRISCLGIDRDNMSPGPDGQPTPRWLPDLNVMSEE